MKARRRGWGPGASQTLVRCVRAATSFPMPHAAASPQIARVPGSGAGTAAGVSKYSCIWAEELVPYATMSPAESIPTALTRAIPESPGGLQGVRPKQKLSSIQGVSRGSDLNKSFLAIRWRASRGSPGQQGHAFQIPGRQRCECKRAPRTFRQGASGPRTCLSAPKLANDPQPIAITASFGRACANHEAPAMSAQVVHAPGSGAVTTASPLGVSSNVSVSPPVDGEESATTRIDPRCRSPTAPDWNKFRMRIVATDQGR